MWTRADIKNYAKDFLHKHYWKAFVVCLIATLLSGGGSSNGSDSNNNNDNINYSNDYDLIEKFEFETDLPSEVGNPIFNFAARNFKSPLFMISGGLFSIMIVVFIIVLITIGFAIEVGKSRFFLQGFKGDASIGKLFSTFNSEEYLHIVKTQFLRGLYNLLWFLLLIIPGIIKTYEYRFVPYVLAEKPNMSANEVISRSREITSGHKMDMFVLDLSFIGWYLLGALFFGIGVFFVDPYAEATYARLYNILAGNDEESEYIEILG